MNTQEVSLRQVIQSLVAGTQVLLVNHSGAVRIEDGPALSATLMLSCAMADVAAACQSKDRYSWIVAVGRLRQVGALALTHGDGELYREIEGLLKGAEALMEGAK